MLSCEGSRTEAHNRRRPISHAYIVWGVLVGAGSAATTVTTIDTVQRCRHGCLSRASFAYAGLTFVTGGVAGVGIEHHRTVQQESVMTDKADTSFSVDVNRDWRIYANPIDGYEMLGVVREGKWDVGALARDHASQLYVLINGGTIKALDQAQVVAALARAKDERPR